MNAENFRHLYEYHLTTNRKIWDDCIVPLDQEKFVQKVEYSVGSVRNHIVHMLNVDSVWFSDLRGEEPTDLEGEGQFTQKEEIRTAWDDVEAKMRDYLANLKDEDLQTRPLTNEEDKDLTVWQVLIHVANHGTDHRAQLLALLNQLGVRTFPQDYVFFAYDSIG